jgi:hypothetical protein
LFGATVNHHVIDTSTSEPAPTVDVTLVDESREVIPVSEDCISQDSQPADLGIVHRDHDDAEPREKLPGYYQTCPEVVLPLSMIISIAEMPRRPVVRRVNVDEVYGFRLKFYETFEYREIVALDHEMNGGRWISTAD